MTEGQQASSQKIPDGSGEAPQAATPQAMMQQLLKMQQDWASERAALEHKCARMNEMMAEQQRQMAASKAAAEQRAAADAAAISSMQRELGGARHVGHSSQHERKERRGSTRTARPHDGARSCSRAASASSRTTDWHEYDRADDADDASESEDYDAFGGYPDHSPRSMRRPR